MYADVLRHGEQMGLIQLNQKCVVATNVEHEKTIVMSQSRRTCKYTTVDVLQ